MKIITKETDHKIKIAPYCIFFYFKSYDGAMKSGDLYVTDIMYTPYSDPFFDSSADVRIYG